MLTMEAKDIEELIPIILHLRSQIRSNGSDTDPDTEVATILNHLVNLQRSFSHTNELSLFNKLRNQILEESNPSSAPSILTTRNLHDLKTKDNFRPAYDLRSLEDLKLDETHLHLPCKVEISSSQKYTSLNFDDLPDYEPLEDIFPMLKSSNIVGWNKLLAYDIMDLVGHPSWPVLLEIISNALQTLALSSELSLLIYASCFRLIQGLKTQLQSIDLIKIVLQHIVLFAKREVNTFTIAHFKLISLILISLEQHLAQEFNQELEEAVVYLFHCIQITSFETTGGKLSFLSTSRTKPTVIRHFLNVLRKVPALILALLEQAGEVRGMIEKEMEQFDDYSDPSVMLLMELWLCLSVKLSRVPLIKDGGQSFVQYSYDRCSILNKKFAKLLNDDLHIVKFLSSLQQSEPNITQDSNFVLNKLKAILVTSNSMRTLAFVDLVLEHLHARNESNFPTILHDILHDNTSISTERDENGEGKVKNNIIVLHSITALFYK